MQSAISPLSFRRVTHYHSRHFRQAMQIYLAEFDRGSRLSISRIRTLLQHGEYQLLIAQHDTQSERPVSGFALIWLCRSPAFVHLDYLAVAHSHKGKGIGTALYRWLLAHLPTISPRAHWLTLEVEDDLIDFYRRSHTKLLEDVPYLFPGPLGPVPMRLMVHDRRSKTSLSRDSVRGIVRGLYCGLHNRPADDPTLRTCLAQIPVRIDLT
jgi:GNAT superfamily N-acetyltransferase